MVGTGAEDPAGDPREAPGALPDGTLTLLFTDIQGSTLLLDRLGLDYREVLSRQRQIMRQAIDDHGGREMGTEGDSFFVVFRTAPAAVAAAVQAQERLAATDWPEQVDVRVRMGMHTGSPTLHEDGYVGMDVHLAARVASTATGGQVLLSDATRALLSGDPAIELRDLGLHRLKDVATPVRLHEVVLPGVPERRPSVRSLGSLADLPAVHGGLVGRDEEVEQVLRLLTPGRVVTVVGPGGVGKSRLAIEVARRRDDLPDGVYFVPLAGASTQEEVWGSLAAAAGLTAGAAASREQVLGGLADRRLLLVLDNLEHLPGAADAVGAIVRSATRAEVLVTSRSPLRLQTEQLLPLQPLGREHASRLFVDQVRRQRPGWTPAREDLQVVGDICDRLDGLPLAVELVAARSRLLTPRAMLAHLDGALDVSGRATDRSVRQHTLRSTLDWSWRLLAPDTARALARLGVFRGPFGIEAAAAVMDRPVDDAVDTLLDLVDASLVQADESSGDPRFRILRVVRSYAQERLAEQREEVADARTRHAEVVAAVVRRECPRLRGTHHVAAVDVLDEQHGNIAHALDWCLREGCRS
ncbi:adenylate/guanylate cyclase domain-containing protein [Ornithinimicrobium flavum]|uniref:adenylate/guanylate cyclase domain-containing protein n=1 Tax=Ornithinimicrobium flavum TaxID=1288636 RepID=UPI00106F14F8|nr:adenylate/guanylate cyclase domain-containing protein [Ornithinimicrobium flavum]